MVDRPKNDLVEIFGYAPDDLSEEARTLWRLGACPFTGRACSKTNHDKTIVYGTCSVTTSFGDCVICPNRIYEGKYAALRRVANDAFDSSIPFYTFEEYVGRRTKHENCVVALGQNSGREIKLGKSLSMDWVLANIEANKLKQYVGIEVQSIDITNNYRDNWYAYKNLSKDTTIIPRSEHGLNWANVHKRLMPQLIRKGLIYSRSKMVKSGIYFVLPDVVYKKFEEIIGADIPLLDEMGPDVVTVHTYKLSDPVPHSQQRSLLLERSIRFSLDEFSNRFISGAHLPSGEDLDNAVRNLLGCE